MSNTRIQDDLYEAVNGEWLATAVIPDDKPTTGGFATLAQEVEKTMMQDFADMAEGKKETPAIQSMPDAIRLYKKALDVKVREEAGIRPVLPLLDLIRAMRTPQDLIACAKEFIMTDVPLPVNVDVQADMKNATKHAFNVWGADIILPDTTYYAEDNEAGKQLLSVWSDMAKQALALTNLSEEDQALFLADTLAFDAGIAKKVKSQLEWADYVKDYNPMSMEDVCKAVAPFDLSSLLYAFYDEAVPKTIIVRDPKAILEMKDYFNEDNFMQYAHWAYVKTLLGALPCLSEEMSVLGHTYRRALMGLDADPSVEKKAFQLAGAFFSEPVGIYYGRTYFGEEAKADVIDMCRDIIATYKKRVKENDFLEEATKEKAILKLSTIEIKMGYPDDVHDYYREMHVTDQDSLYMSVSRLNRILKNRTFEKLNKDVDKSEWWMPGHMVNACYDPSNNDITFPAAILQKPFYSIEQTRSENLGGIGAVIGHEISHAFDNNGSHFDEHGNLADWWSEKDFAAFEKKTKEMIEEWDGIPFHGSTVSGELTVSENIADNGGMAVTLDIMSTLEGADYEGYFKNWARVWCQKAKEEYVQYLLKNDVHSPAALRANIQVRNFDEWYSTFDVKDSDQMYIAPEKRVHIW